MAEPKLQAPQLPPSDVEGIKLRSNFLRGTFRESLADRLTNALRPDDVRRWAWSRNPSSCA